MFVDYFPGRDANKIKSKYYNTQRQNNQPIEGGSSYDSSYVEQQRSCVSYQDTEPRIWPDDGCYTDDMVYDTWNGNNDE